jgi:hypothetical protein
MAAGAMMVPATVAGRWDVRVMPEMGDSTLVEYELNATDSMDGWTVTFPGRDPIEVRIVAASGDSVVTEMGPYSSALREGVNVRASSVFRLEGERLVGTTVARYEVTTADSVVRLRSEGMRIP